MRSEPNTLVQLVKSSISVCDNRPIRIITYSVARSAQHLSPAHQRRISCDFPASMLSMEEASLDTYETRYDKKIWSCVVECNANSPYWSMIISGNCLKTDGGFSSSSCS